MYFKEIKIQNGFEIKKFLFNKEINAIYSKKNSVGKSTLLRALLYSIGYQIPSTIGLDFNKMNFDTILVNNDIEYHFSRSNDLLQISYLDKNSTYSVKEDFYTILSILLGSNNPFLMDNILGAFYIDQEKGWTLLNRGKVIGRIHFSIENLIRALAHKDCRESYMLLSDLEKKLTKYNYMKSIAEYQRNIQDPSLALSITNIDDIMKNIDLIKLQRAPLKEELKQVNQIIAANTTLEDYISKMKLIVKDTNGDIIYVNKDTLFSYNDNKTILLAKRDYLVKKISHLNRYISKLMKNLPSQDSLLSTNTLINEFDSNINKIKINYSSVCNVISHLNKDIKKIKMHLDTRTPKEEIVISKLHEYIEYYLNLFDPNASKYNTHSNYIFTKDLKSLSGATLYYNIIAFRLGYIKIIKEFSNIILPILLDSPSSREVEFNSVKKVLSIIQKDFPEHQMIIASIFDFNLKDQHTIELKTSLFD